MFKLDPKYRQREILYQRLILFGLAVLLVVIYLGPIWSVLGRIVWICLPFMMGGLLCFVLQTTCSLFMDLGKRFFNMKENKWTWIAMKIFTLLFILSAIALFIYVMLPSIIDSVQNLMGLLPAYSQSLFSWIYRQTSLFPGLEKWLIAHESLFTDTRELADQLLSFLFAGSAMDTVQSLQDMVFNTFSWLWTLFLSLVFSVIAFFNTRQMMETANLIASAWLPKRAYQGLKSFVILCARTFSSYLRGTVLECIILGTLVSLFCWIFQIPNALLIGVFCGICALVPMFGATFGALICVLLISVTSASKALTFLIGFICIQQIEGNFIYPNVVGKSVGLPPMYVLFSITIGGSLAGILGMVLSIPAASVLYALIMERSKARMENRQNHLQPEPVIKDSSDPESISMTNSGERSDEAASSFASNPSKPDGQNSSHSSSQKD